jgi:hypothetical protein
MIGARFAVIAGALTLAFSLVPQAAGAASPATISGPAATAQCPLGWSVSISGSVAVIGAPGAADGRGVTCVFSQSRGAWHLQAALSDPGKVKGDGFGETTAVSSTSAGTFAAIGSEGNDMTIEPDGITDMYVRSGSTWRRQQTLTDPGHTAGDQFGSSVAMSGTTAVIAADGAANGAGLVYVYVRSGGAWRLQATLRNPHPGQNAASTFGGDVSISGSTVIVGDVSPLPDFLVRPTREAGIAAATIQAEAYVFARSGSTWHLQARLTDTSPSEAWSGAAVAVSGNLALLGAPNDGSGQGGVYLFRRTGTTWRRVLVLHDPTKDDSNFGTSVAIAGGVAAVGAPFGQNCGVAYAYEESGQKWPLREKLLPPGKCPKNTEEVFGWSVAISGKTAIVGGDAGAYVTNVP